jgi:integrase
MPKRKQLPKNMYRRRGRIGVRIQIEGQRIRLGEWPDSDAGLVGAQEALKQAQWQIEDGDWVEPSTVTVGEYLEGWLARRERKVVLGEIRAVTFDGDRRCLENKVIPGLGSMRLEELSRDHIESLAVELLNDGHQRGGPLAPISVRNAVKVLRNALNDAVGDGLIPIDPSKGVQIKDTSHTEHDFDDLATWGADELSTLLPKLRLMDRHMIGLAAATGLRRSELCGLLWRNVDLEAGIIRVRSTITMVSGQPIFAFTVKSRSSRRSIAVDRDVVAYLKERKADQARQRLAAGSAWSNELGFVFTWDDGRPTSPEWFTKRVQKIAAKHGLEPIGSHGLRHTFATIALENGANLKIVSEALGHADIGVTADVYSHVTENAAREAAAIVGAAIFRAVPQ